MPKAERLRPLEGQLNQPRLPRAHRRERGITEEPTPIPIASQFYFQLDQAVWLADDEGPDPSAQRAPFAKAMISKLLVAWTLMGVCVGVHAGG